MLIVGVGTRPQRQRAPAYCRDITDTVAGVICQSQRRRSDWRWKTERCGDCTEQSGSKVGQVNRHLRQSYDANFKIMVVNAAEASNNCQPAKKYGVTECNVRRWWVKKKKKVWKMLAVREKLIVVLKVAASKRLIRVYVHLLLRNETKACPLPLIIRISLN